MIGGYRNGFEWTPERLERLSELHRDGATRPTIARTFGCSYENVRHGLRKLGAIIEKRPRHHRPARTRTTRNCLCCGRPFQSDGPHDRLCGCETTRMSALA